MKKGNIIKTLTILVRGILAGIMISIGGTVNLMVDNKIVGSLLFGIGLFMIVVNSYNLYTGKIGYIINNKLTYVWELLVTIIGNVIGTVGCGYLFLVTRIGPKIYEKAQVLCDVKLHDEWGSILVLSIFCGMLMFLAVDLYKRLSDNGRYIAVFICVVVFILAGFEHCVANMYYFSVANMWNLKSLGYLLLMIVGNSLGSIIISFGNKLISNS